MPFTQEEFDALPATSVATVFGDTSSGSTLLWIVVPLIIMFIGLLISMRKDTGSNKIMELYKFHEGYRRIWIVVSTAWILGAAYPLVIQPFHENYMQCKVGQDSSRVMYQDYGCIVDMTTYSDSYGSTRTSYTLAGNGGMTTPRILMLILKYLGILLVPPLGLPLLLKFIREIVKWIRGGFMATGSYRNPSSAHPLIDEVNVKGNVEGDENTALSEDDG